MSAAVTPIRPSKTLPHSLDAEASVIGGVLLDNKLLGSLDMLETRSFYDHRHKVVWEAIRNLENAGSPIDPVTLEVEIEKTGKLEAIGGVGFIGSLALRIPTTDNVLEYARIVRDHALVREVALSAAKAVDRAHDWEYEADEFLGEHLADLQRLERGYHEANEKLPIITIEDTLDENERLARTPIFETPFPELNKTLGFGGLLSGQVYYVAGGTGFGKTSWIATVVRAHAEAGRPALIAFWEMFGGYYTARMAAPILGVPATQILRGHVDRRDISNAFRAMPGTIEMLDSPSMSVLRRTVERTIRLGRGAPLLVVDYIQLLGERVMATMARPDPRVAAGMASAGLRELAKETGCAIIAVSAAGRSASKDLNKDVRKHPPRDLIAASRETGSIEFDGAGVIVLSVSEDMDGDEHIATMTVAKARFGMTAHIDSRFGGHSGGWREIGRVHKVTKIESKPDDGSLRQSIIDLLKEEPATSKTSVCKRTGKNYDASRLEWDSMLEEGVIVARGRKFMLGDRAVPADLQTALLETQQ